jgi:putative ABC transport system permease protein
MSLLLGLLVGLKEIWAHKFRSFLTMLGIILGVCSLVGMFALVAGMTSGMESTLNEIGGLEKVSVVDQDPPESQQHLAELSPGRTMKDAVAIENGCPLIALVSPEIELRGARVTRGRVNLRPRSVVGARKEFIEVNSHEVEFGRFLSDLDQERFHRVCVIGTEVRDAMFPVTGSDADVDPIGQNIEINGQSFTIVGVLRYYESETARKKREAGQPDVAAQRAQERRSSYGGRGGGPSSRGSNWFSWKNDIVIIPLTTMQNIFRSGAKTEGAADLQLTALNLRVADVRQLSEAIQQVKNVLLTTHHGIEDFGFNTQENWSDRIKEQTGNFMRTGGLIASISLIVGGIGIMNIMLASISERIREIGIRKAIGARQRDIFAQILAEGIVLAVLGGTIGLVFAFGLVKLLQMLAPFDFTPIVRPQAMVISFLFSACVGVVAGLYPAVKAARLDPIEALRYQ